MQLRTERQLRPSDAECRSGAFDWLKVKVGLYRPFRARDVFGPFDLGLRSPDSLQPKLSYGGISGLKTAENRNRSLALA